MRCKKIKIISDLAEILEGLPCTASQFARQVGITPQHLTFLKQNKRTPSLALAIKISDELNKPVKRLWRIDKQIEGGE